jgi:hypothetical protein
LHARRTSHPRPFDGQSSWLPPRWLHMRCYHR